MLCGVPNFSFSVGYTNASWTLKCRPRRASTSAGSSTTWTRTATPIARRSRPRPEVELAAVIDLEAGYVLRSLDELPKQGARAPWRLRQNYPYDVAMLRWGSIETGMEFKPAPATAPAPAATA